ncbi:pyruvate dehydrogenase (acetyl-transferring), homodimeric type [Candidatus Ichthyocystis hellenicum]|uniref:pyruvate dehydrogenase (acetyl-transferring), homodimeric type n=1 Tax=Candidatus Ichthyocystis hellenicum TaxID=1561003 RepID=UPI000B2606C9|nr:pyruvate dehydrogenase (acetyl-transferring), homodimeric type [Candidatus Ichthyocystis hellenicum]
MIDSLCNALLQNDSDPDELKEWIDALRAVIAHIGPERAQDILIKLTEYAQQRNIHLINTQTPYKNTITPEESVPYPGDLELETTITQAIRWNATMIVARANHIDGSIGGHISTFASSCLLYEVGFHHFWKAPHNGSRGDAVYIQGHSSPGIYARAFLEGRMSENQINLFRQDTVGGVPSYPHPYLMPNFWQYPTVSMGLGPLCAIHHARFNRYLSSRGLLSEDNSHVWAFLGDGEMDEPESTAALAMAARHQLDNITFVVNCNLQRLDGPVRGSGKIIQELESTFHGAGWNVIKVIWGSEWDELFEKPSIATELAQIMMACVDGDYQTFNSKDAAYFKENFFGRHPKLKEFAETWPLDKIAKLSLGGHDHSKVYNAYYRALNTHGKPSVILAKTIKGYDLGAAGEAQNTAHNQKKISVEHLKMLRDKWNIPLSDAEVEAYSFYSLEPKSESHRYLIQKRKNLHGFLPQRIADAPSIKAPDLSIFKSLCQSSGERTLSTTMVFVRILGVLLRQEEIAKFLVPIVPDEARTFGMEGLYRQIGIWSHKEQNYTPPDAEQLMWYREDKKGQLIEEGINEAGATATWIAAGNSYAQHGIPMIPMYIFYSMFGMQRTGDLLWMAGDILARGFLLGATSGRTTLNGEGLQHEDGHSHIIATTLPNCKSYDPTFSYELCTIIQHGIKEMYEEQNNVHYYVTLMNENYTHPEMPDNSAHDIMKGIYLFSPPEKTSSDLCVQLIGCGSIFTEIMAAKELMKNDWGIDTVLWSAPSLTELARDGQECLRWNFLHPDKPSRVPFVTEKLSQYNAPILAATDYMRSYAEQIRAFVPKKYVTLGTDGYGRSGTRAQLRNFFEISRYWITVYSLSLLHLENKIDASTISAACEKYDLLIDDIAPWLR